MLSILRVVATLVRFGLVDVLGLRRACCLGLSNAFVAHGV